MILKVIYLFYFVHEIPSDRISNHGYTICNPSTTTVGYTFYICISKR